jgi:hypothetical protein
MGNRSTVPVQIEDTHGAAGETARPELHENGQVRLGLFGKLVPVDALRRRKRVSRLDRFLRRDDQRNRQIVDLDGKVIEKLKRVHGGGTGIGGLPSFPQDRVLQTA